MSNPDPSPTSVHGERVFDRCCVVGAARRDPDEADEDEELEEDENVGSCDGSVVSRLGLIRALVLLDAELTSNPLGGLDHTKGMAKKEKKKLAWILGNTKQVGGRGVGDRADRKDSRGMPMALDYTRLRGQKGASQESG